MVRFLHTADWQLGMGFSRTRGDAGARLRLARLEAIDRLGAVAEEHAAEFLVVAGDLFDAPDVSDTDVLAPACERIGALGLPVHVIPGNHDFAFGADAIWDRPAFRRDRPDNLIVHRKGIPWMPTDGGFALLPCPLARRHVTSDPASWITEAALSELPEKAPRIVLAHGSVKAFGKASEQSRNLIDVARLESLPIDFVALGDWHGKRKVSRRTWYSGAPEPTTFRDNEPGFALIVDLDERGAEPDVLPVHVATTRWIEHAVTLATSNDVDDFISFVDGLGSASTTVVRLTGGGALPAAERARFETARADLRRRVVSLLDEASVHVALTEDDFASLDLEGWPRSAATELRDAATEGDEEAARALDLLYRLAAVAGAERC